jgi:hypothetical protein
MPPQTKPDTRTMPPAGWEQLDHGLYQTTDCLWRVSQPAHLATEMRHRWVLGHRETTTDGWQLCGDWATMQEAFANAAARRHDDA